jgi:hypothetical protein
MYEKPELTRVGEAQDVILGIIATGDDCDMNYMPPPPPGEPPDYQ